MSREKLLITLIGLSMNGAAQYVYNNKDILWAIRGLDVEMSSQHGVHKLRMWLLIESFLSHLYASVPFIRGPKYIKTSSWHGITVQRNNSAHAIGCFFSFIEVNCNQRTRILSPSTHI